MYVPTSELRKDGQPVGLNCRRIPASTRAFAATLAALMQGRAVTAVQLANRLGYSDQSIIGHILAARIRFPVKRAGEFADALGLTGCEREDFIDQAYLSVSSQRVQDLVHRAQPSLPTSGAEHVAASDDDSEDLEPTNQGTIP